MHWCDRVNASTVCEKGVYLQRSYLPTVSDSAVTVGSELDSGLISAQMVLACRGCSPAARLGGLGGRQWTAPQLQWTT